MTEEQLNRPQVETLGELSHLRTVDPGHLGMQERRRLLRGGELRLQRSRLAAFAFSSSFTTDGFTGAGRS
jgi:hypothetical protein